MASEKVPRDIQVQLDNLRADLGAIDDFFRDQYDYFGSSRTDIERSLEGFRKGYEVLSTYPCSPEAFPLLNFTDVAGYSDKEDMGGGRRFFIEVEMWNITNPHVRSYSFRIRMYQDPIHTINGSEVIDRYFTIPADGRGNPLERMLSSLEPFLV